MRALSTSISLVGLLALAGCYQLPRASQPLPAGARVVESMPPVAQEPVLYARDGSPVRSAESGAVQTLPTSANRDLGADEGGSRLYLLELYQEAIEQKEELAFENSRQAQALDLALVRERELEGRLRALEDENSTLRDSAVQLEKTNIELAERLTTAQIRRLEAEKMLLEATLEWNRAMQADSDGQAQAGSPR